MVHPVDSRGAVHRLPVVFRVFAVVAILAVLCLLWLGPPVCGASPPSWKSRFQLTMPMPTMFVKTRTITVKKVGYEKDDDYENDWFGTLLYISGGLFLTYITLAGFLNATGHHRQTGVSDRVHVPLPWFQPPPLHTADIAQFFFVRRRVVYAKGSMREIHSFYDV